MGGGGAKIRGLTGQVRLSGRGQAIAALTRLRNSSRK